MQADLVAQHIVDGIGGIGNKRLTDGMEEFFDISTAHTQQRTDHSAILRTDARKPVNARTIHQVHQQGLYRIVAVMSHTDRLGTKILAQLMEIAITQFAGSHLDAHLMQGGIVARIEMSPMDWDILFGTQLTDEGLVAIRLLATKVEIAMGCLDAIAQLFQYQQQGHAVSTTTERHDMQTVA